MKKYRVGSSILHLTNCKDVDYVILSDEYGKYKRIYNKETKEDLIYIEESYLQSILSFKEYNKMLLIYNYQYDRELIGNDFPIEYHLLDYKEELKKYIFVVVDYQLFNFNKMITYGENKCCSPLIYHIAYNVFILKNNSPILTSEQLSIVQKLHDGVMPIEYIDTLTNIVYELKKADN